MTVNEALFVSAAIWATCAAVTYGLGSISPLYLMTAGTYCFFEFASPVCLSDSKTKPDEVQTF